MEARHKILLLDDDPDLLALYRELLAQLPSQPEILATTSGARAMAMLEADAFRLMILDLKMPRMDGLQVLSIVRRKYPELRTIVLTQVQDEEFRSRAYALGVDQYWLKPGTESEVKLFLDCVESLLGLEADSGFRGVQSKSLVDIVQLECLSQSSSVLRITNGPLTGKIWVNNGDLVDAEAEDLRGEEAAQVIFRWKAGTFELLPPEPDRPRTILKSYNAILLESAQAMDESQGRLAMANDAIVADAPSSQLMTVTQVEGVEFALVLKAAGKKMESRGLENPERMAKWERQTLESFHSLGERLRAGVIEQIECLGAQRNAALARKDETEFCIGWQRTLSAEQIRESMKKILVLWDS